MGPLASLCKRLVLSALLCVGATGLHSFQELSPALLARWSHNTLSTVCVAVIQLLACIRTSQALGPTDVLAEDTNQADLRSTAPQSSASLTWLAEPTVGVTPWVMQV